jgi:uncharacterized protein (DUF305 family)
MIKDVSRFALLLLLVPTLALAALRQDSQHQTARTSTASPDWSELMATMTTMDTAMAAVPSSADSDTNFVRLMLPHHQAAIEMAKTQLLHGKDPQLRRLAQEVITDQQSEIQLMQLWLQQHQKNAPEPNPLPAPSAKQLQ